MFSCLRPQVVAHAYGQPKAQLPPPHPKTLGGPPNLPLAVIWYPWGAHLPSGRPSPCLPYCRPGKKKGRRRKGKKEAEGIEVKKEMRGFGCRCPWRLRFLLICPLHSSGLDAFSAIIMGFPAKSVYTKVVDNMSEMIYFAVLCDVELEVLAVTCLHEGMGLATQSQDMISLSHDYCNILIRIFVFRHNGLIKY
uniref:Uncharacterized protein n=1 Tax=Oryza barthii TaxID=65489 RepID=A0A0D3F5F7_9ORYZ